MYGHKKQIFFAGISLATTPADYSFRSKLYYPKDQDMMVGI
jgi:hypothetical protein